MVWEMERSRILYGDENDGIHDLHRNKNTDSRNSSWENLGLWRDNQTYNNQTTRKKSKCTLTTATIQEDDTSTTQKLFAFVSKTKQAKWGDLFPVSLHYRCKSLKRILLLLNKYHGFKNADYEFVDMM